MIYFNNDTILPIEAAIIMGVNAKAEGKIGQFGTGLKYAIAGILARNGSVTIRTNGTTYQFATRPATVNGKDFQIVTCNGTDCGFTTHLGAHWEPWQLFRELASNCLDEGGVWGKEDAGQLTCITVDCVDVERAETTEQVFLNPEGEPIISSPNLDVYAAPCGYYYNDGIRCGIHPLPVTINLHGGTLTEDRTVDFFSVRYALSLALGVAQKDPQRIARLLANDENDGFFGGEVMGLSNCKPHETLGAELYSMRRSIRSDAGKALAKAYGKEHGHAVAECSPSAVALRYIEHAKEICAVTGVKVPESVRMTQDLPDGVLGSTDMNTREIWISTRAEAMGRDQFVITYLEEAFHADTGHRDETRAMQDMLLHMVAALAERLL